MRDSLREHYGGGEHDRKIMNISCGIDWARSIGIIEALVILRSNSFRTCAFKAMGGQSKYIRIFYGSYSSADVNDSSFSIF